MNSKPVSLIRRELTENICKAINESELDISIVELILRDIMRDVSNIAQTQLQKDMETYRQSMEEVSVEE